MNTQDDDLIKFYERTYGPFIHMFPNDKAIWMRYLMQGGSVFAPFTYDARVGQGVTMPVGSTSQALTIAFALTTKRIDALSFGSNQVRVFEVKPRAGLGAIGQLIGYRDLYLKTFGSDKNVEMHLITDKLQPDMVTVLTINNIQYTEVGY